MAKRKRIFQGDRLKTVRGWRNLTQEELASRVSISQSQLWKYESGGSEPSPDVIGRFSKELEITTDYLLGLVDHPNEHLQIKDLSKQEYQLLTAFRKGDLRRILEIAAGEVPDGSG